ncbi:hypothetical protein [Neisseria wadsworthii]|uniref:Lipoprotein n=1 Tax=Neisseria wadsworthii 9715 TaxID=1030841 RepID=G4CP02_9NEIS|nr:hypothetical protein [Neisseria wadsworthii]EGZ48516.1 hypothetical protein HMPREF9370_0811 [Neisseria wadsworthii 9715]
MKRIVVLSAALLLAGCSESDTKESFSDEKKASQETAISKAKISPDALSEYPKKGFPKLWKKWGKDGIARIIENDKLAIEQAAKFGKCDVVEAAAYSDRSVYPNKIVSFVDCANGERFYYEGGADENRAVPQSAKMIREVDAMMKCREMVKPLLKNSSSFDMNLSDGRFFADRTSGNASYVMSFSSKNDFGAEVDNEVKCSFPADNAPEIEVIR